MQRTHRRGASQQIPRSFKLKDYNFIDFKQNAFSSEHTRSTALTNYKHSNKDKPSKQKDKKKKEGKINEVQWNQEEAPYRPQQVLKIFSHFLQPFERVQIQQYQNIWFIGKQNKTPQSSRLQEQGFLSFKYGGHIAYRYEIIERINRGSFGEVLKVFDHKAKQYQALKIVKKNPEYVKQTFIQISILTTIKEKDKGDISGIIRIKDFTIFRDHICIAFELMDSNLYELLHANQFQGLEESFVRIFALQMLNSLNFLEKMNIIHCDIKPENFVLKVWGKSGIKLVDFGTSCYQDQQVYTYIQSRFYRAPQILFNSQYTTSIDMWSFGCLIAELCLGKPIFPGNSDLHQLVYMINLLGYPKQQFSKRCEGQIESIRENKYIQRDESGKIPKQSLQRFFKNTGYKLDEESLKPLEERLPGSMFPLIHFLKQILKWEAKDRINAAQALQHPWVTTGLPQQIRELYTIYQNLNKTEERDLQVPKKKKKVKSKSKSKSKSKEKSQQKNESITKSKVGKNRNSINFSRNEEKKGKFDLPQTLVTIKSKVSKLSQEKSRNDKTIKSPYSNKKIKN